MFECIALLCLFLRGYNKDKAEIIQFYSIVLQSSPKTLVSISIKLGTKHPWVMVIQILK